MAIEAVLSNHKKMNFKIGIVVLLVLGIWFAYDGYYNEKFIEKNTENYGTEDARPNSTLSFNRKSPPFFIGAAALLGIYWFLIKDKKIVADESGLVIGDKTIAYDSIEKVDKTNFESKGYFVLTYKNSSGDEKNLNLNDRTFDNLTAILDEIVAKIS